MLDKLSKAAGKAGDAVKDGVGAIVNTATQVTDTINEKAVRLSTAQMYRILEIAVEELKGRPLAEQPATLTASVDVGVVALQMQIQLGGGAPSTAVSVTRA